MNILTFKYLVIRFLLFILVLLLQFQKVFSQDYFQQETNYKISVTLDDRNHFLNGSESVEYINNSPDTLRFMFYHLWPNGYSDNNTTLAREIFNKNGKSKLFRDNELNGYIDSLEFRVDGNIVQWNYLNGTPDICKIYPGEPLLPGDTITITTPFRVKIPKGVTSRMGHIGESYQISQWYPKPAVYDKSGWHQMPYLDQGEFYSEYGSFDVSITLPANYTVGATGTLQNEEEKRRLDKLSSDTTWMENPDVSDAGFPTSSDQMKTLRYTENQVHDFAWFADKRFHVLKGSVKLPDSGRVITTWVMFTNQESHLWMKGVSYVNNAIWNFSKWIGDYPYNSYTAVQSALNSGAGMEYPGLTVIGLAGDPYLLDEVIAHEICHSWFYSAIGSDERRFPFMDESLASAYETRYMDKRYPGKKLWEISIKNRKLATFFDIEGLPVQRIQELQWLIPDRRNSGQPGNLSSTGYSYDNYGSIIYSKMGQGFNYLRAYLGDSLFDSVMHDYYRIWKNRHPQPDDLRAVFELVTAKNLSWFFDDFLGTTKKLDYKIVRAQNQKVLIKNSGELNSPLLIAGMIGDSIASEKWEEGFRGKKWIDVTPDNYTEIRIDPGHQMTELFRLNNNIHSSGIFRKSDPVQFQLLYTMGDPDKRTLIYMPAFDWNKEDGVMAGLALQNKTAIPKQIEYFILPLYTFRSQRLTGSGQISFNSIPYNSNIRLATYSISVAKFGAPGNQYYNNIKIGTELYFRNPRMNEPVSKNLFGYYISASDLNQINSLIKSQMRSYLQFGYISEKTGIINPYRIQLSFESGKSYQKTSLELNYKYSYRGKKNGLEIRLFAGTMLQNLSEDTFYAFSPSGRSGREQYLYQEGFPDRFSKFPKTFFSRQMTLSEGGLITSLSDTLGYSRWLCSISLSSTLPGFASKIPVKPFINLLVNDHGMKNSSPIYFEAGLKTGIWDLFEVWIPLLVSDNINTLSVSLKDRIRFVFRLDKLNPLRSKSQSAS